MAVNRGFYKLKPNEIMTQTLEKIAIIGGSLILLVIGAVFVAQLIIQNIQIG